MTTTARLLSILSLILPIIHLSLLPSLTSASRFPSRKTWWAKQITDDLHVAGRLTETQMKFAKDAKFKSLISLFTFRSRDLLGGYVNDSLPTSEQAAKMAAMVGIKFSIISTSDSQGEDWAKRETVDEFSKVFNSFPKPVLLYDNTGYAASYVGLMHYLTNEPRIDVKSFFEQSAAMGYPHVESDKLRTLALKVGKAKGLRVGELARPNLNLPTWYVEPAQWWHKPLSSNIWVCGQIQVNHLTAVRRAGFDVVLNLRRGMTVRGTPSQEESVLINVRDKTGTYGQDGRPYRQTTEALENSRLDSDLPNTYISASSTTNYQTANYLQFGDHIGYNEDISRRAFRDAGVDYLHFPIGGVHVYALSMWEAYRDRLMELARTKNILIQCRSAYRSTVIGLLMHGCLEDRSSTQVLEQARRMGFRWVGDVMSSKEMAVVNLLKAVLDNREVQCKTQSLSGETQMVLPGGSQGLRCNLYGLILVLVTFLSLYT